MKILFPKTSAIVICTIALCLFAVGYSHAQNVNGADGTFTGTVGIGTTTVVAGGKLEASGIIYSNTGGFKFPDGTVQTTAAPTVGTNTLSVVNNMGGGNNSGAPLSLIGSGRNNIIQGTADYAIILGGKGNVIENQSLNYTSSTLAPANPGSHNFISSGELNTIKPNVNHAAIIGGRNNTVASGAVNSIILGGNGITATQPNTVYAQNIAVSNALTSPSFMFDSINGVRYSAATGSTPSIFSLGRNNQPVFPQNVCFAPNVNQAYMMVPQTQIFSTMQNGNVNSAFLMGSDWSTGNGTLEVEGTDNNGQENNSLQINNQCGRNTYINTNSGLSNGGGTVFMGNRVQMALSAQIGWNFIPPLNANYDVNTALNIFPSNNGGNGIKLNTWTNGISLISINNPTFFGANAQPFVVLNSNGTINAKNYLKDGQPFSGEWQTIGNNILNTNSGTVYIGKVSSSSYVANEFKFVVDVDNASDQGMAVRGKGMELRFLATNPGTTIGSSTGSITFVHSISGLNTLICAKLVTKVLEVAPDYVFEKNYNLMPLSEIQKYIAENKHLPEVPSAKEIAKDGLSVGDMSLVLLKKIEELTLHMIELQKRNDLMAEEINKLKNEK